MTEAYNYAMNPPFGRKRRGSICMPSHGTALRLVDRHGVDVPEGGSGRSSSAAPR